jgi:septal ring factor EnvC (AmiA/AmiB activator)
MKGKTAKINKKETDTEMLARLMKQGFDRMDKGFEQVDKRFEQVDKRLEKVDERLGSLEVNVSSLQQEVVAINVAQDETNRRLTSIERKQTGILEILDETVHKSEFKALVNRVKVLEGKK